MAGTSELKIRCSSCGHESAAAIYPSINVSQNPELKGKVMDGSLFVHECPHCGRSQVLKYNLLYHDPDEKVLICLSDVNFVSDGMEGYTCRMVSDVGSLMEKVKIFDAGLDDVAMEMCKYVTAGELGKPVDLKFLRIDGADHDITLTYPQDGRMEMLEIGFNVYEDCAGIINRNPVLRSDSSGLSRVDQEWIQKYFK